MWCHVLLTTPVWALTLFFVLPFSTAAIVYLGLVLLSVVLYAKIVESMRAPITTGVERLIGQVVTTTADGSIHWQGEWWTARPRLPVRQVRIVGMRGLELQVEPLNPAEWVEQPALPTRSASSPPLNKGGT